MRLPAGLLLLAAAVHAGVIQGVVLENASGRPLARTIVRLQPVPGQTGTARGLQTRVNRLGHFVFSPVPSGLYFITTQHEGFFPAAYGQRRPTGQGTPVQVTQDSDLFAEFRMRHMGAISGRVLDENGVGLAGVTVLAYRARLPLRSAANGKSDDRGVYRIAGLEPGKYWIRSAAAVLDDGSGILPTFGPLSRETRDARVQTVNLDEEAREADVQPEPGSLFRVTGKPLCDRPDGTPVTLVLSSESMKRSTRGACGSYYRLEGLAPGGYEIFASYDDMGGFGFVELGLDHDSDLGNVQVMKAPVTEVEFRNATTRNRMTASVTLTGRRDDLSGDDVAITIPARPMLAPRHWQMNGLPDATQYVQSITTGLPPRPLAWRTERPPDWQDVFIEQRGVTRLQVLLSDQAGRIHGTMTAGGASIPGVPVFLWPMAEEARRILGGSPQVLADTQGRFDFQGLPPGDYRLLSTFDYSQADLDVFDEARAQSITVAASQAAIVEIPLWVAP